MVIRAQIVFGIRRFWQSKMAPTKSREKNSHIWRAFIGSCSCEMTSSGSGAGERNGRNIHRGLSGIIKHLLDSLRQGGHDHIAKQRIQASQHQSADDHRHQDLHSSIHIALTSAVLQGSMGMDHYAVHLACQLIHPILHGIFLLILRSHIHGRAGIIRRPLGRVWSFQTSLALGLGLHKSLLVGIQNSRIKLHPGLFCAGKTDILVLAVSSPVAGHGDKQPLGAVHDLDASDGKAAVDVDRGGGTAASLRAQGGDFH